MTDRKPLTNLETTFSHLLARRHSRSLLRRLTIAPPGTVDFSSNDYLSLSTHPEIRSTFLSLLQAPQPITPPPSITGTSNPNAPSQPPPIGSRGSRLLDGNHPLTVSLESLISTHHRSPSGLLFNSGFDANVGLFSTLPQPSDVIVYDELIHASVHDGMRLSRVAAPRRLAFAHNDVGGLRRVLEGIVGDREVGEKVRAGKANVFVAVEAVYSMDGDVAPLRAMLDLVDEMLPKGNGYVIVDEAHATGVFGGAGGRGLTCELGVEDRLLTHLHTLIRTTHALLTALIARLPPNTTTTPLLSLAPLPANPSPIVPLFTPHPRALAAHCQAAGYTVRAIVAPTVPHGAERVRVCLHAGNTVEEVRGLVRAVEGWVEARLKEEGGVGGGGVLLPSSSSLSSEEERVGGGGGSVVAGRAVLEKARL
ncbi:aminotransferase class I and II [Lasiodiplodia theobromae]|nr:aminotransferase class I and II [Lasiodiplodia theobromae]